MIGLVEELVLLAIEDDGAIAHTAGSVGFGMSLIGAALVELSNHGRIDADLDSLRVMSREPTDHPVLDRVLQLLVIEETLTVEQWVLRLASETPELVRLALKSLVGRGVLEQTESRFLWVLRSRRYPVIDGREQKEAKLRILSTLLGEDLPTPHDTVLLGLARAGGLLEAFLTSAEIARLEGRMEQVSGIDLFVRGVESAIREDQVERARAMMLPMY
jgi:hypothetical protein